MTVQFCTRFCEHNAMTAALNYADIAYHFGESKSQITEENMNNQTRFLLNESDIPRFWYNINADMPVPPNPVLNPQTMEPVTPDFLSVLFPMDLILQEVSTERYIEIPEEVREIYKLYRPTPLIRALRLERSLDTPAHIYYKYEGASPAGSHKPNTATPHAYYNKRAGTKAMTTETGAGQWGSALALACNFFDLSLEVYMVKISYNQKLYRRVMMETYRAQVFASPTNRTQYGRSVLQDDPDSPALSADVKTILEFKWKIVGGTILASLVLTIAFQIITMFHKQ